MDSPEQQIFIFVIRIPILISIYYSMVKFTVVSDHLNLSHWIHLPVVKGLEVPACGLQIGRVVWIVVPVVVDCSPVMDSSVVGADPSRRRLTNPGRQGVVWVGRLGAWMGVLGQALSWQRVAV